MVDYTIFGLLGLGLLFGLRHALDADHVAAVSTLVSKHKSLRKSSLLGIFWGLGHTITLFLVGILVLLFKITIPDRVAMSFEFIVGALLVILGMKAMYEIKKNKLHVHKHKHDGIEHIHFHSHKNTKEHSHKHQSFFVGLAHGLAGSSALMLLVFPTIDSKILALLYILLFSIGSIIGMMIFSSIISLPFVWLGKFNNLNNFFRYGTAFVSILLGFSIMIGRII